MRLLDVQKLKLTEFPNEKTRPSYAILSHTWSDGEVSFHDLQTPTASSMAGYAKIKKCCELAIEDGFEYVWIDTCCLDKTSSAELSEAINSMYLWYQSATVCYAYLSDVQSGGSPSDSSSSFSNSRWFTRGWTLQELLAPKVVVFFDRNWVDIGTKSTLQEDISRITGVPRDALLNFDAQAETFSVAQRMSWAAMRETSRAEDTAYCLMGIFNVNMPTLYGEGKKAFIRLQYEIMKESDDHSLFAWVDETETRPNQNSGFISESESRFVLHNVMEMDGDLGVETGLLSSSPRHFRRMQDVRRAHIHNSKRAYSVTNNGIHIWLPMVRVPVKGPKVYQVVFNCDVFDGEGPLSIYLKQKPSGQYARIVTSVVFTSEKVKYDYQTPVELYVKGTYLKDSGPAKRKPSSYKFHLVDNPSPHTGYVVLASRDPDLWKHKLVSLPETGAFSDSLDLSYFIVGPNGAGDASARALIALGVSKFPKSKLFCSIRSEESDIEETIAAARLFKDCDNLRQFHAVFNPDVDAMTLGERITKRLPSGQSISIDFRIGPESLDKVQTCRVMMEFTSASQHQSSYA